MFEGNIEIIKNCFEEYKGTGAYFTLYLVAILYLFFKEKDKRIRAFTIYFPATILLVIMNPLFNKLVGKVLKSGTYWRTFWMLPMGITLAYTCVKIISELEKKWQKIVTSIFLIAIIMISGKYIFTEENFKNVDNWYKLPDDEVWAIQIVSADEEEYKKVLPSYYIVPYIRQIDANILVAYPRSATGYSQKSMAVLVDIGDVESVANKAIETKSNYIIMRKDTEKNGEFSDYGFEMLAQTLYYTIYKQVKE